MGEYPAWFSDNILLFALTITAPFSGSWSFKYWNSTYPTPSELAPSMMRRSFFSLSYGDSRIWVTMISLTARYSASRAGVQQNFPAPAVAFLNKGMFNGRFGYQACKDANIPQYTWTSFLQVGFLSSSNAFILLFLGAMNITSSCFTTSALMMLPPNSTSSPMHSLDGFNLRFLSEQNSMSFTIFFSNSSKLGAKINQSSMFLRVPVLSNLHVPSVK